VVAVEAFGMNCADGFGAGVGGQNLIAAKPWRYLKGWIKEALPRHVSQFRKNEGFCGTTTKALFA
jgi:hypothetical protein